jgi:aryl-alcohol dehydrogenase-like predicted oxidoreductase
MADAKDREHDARQPLSRRQFLQTATMAGAGAALSLSAHAQGNDANGGQSPSGQQGDQQSPAPSGTEDSSPTQSSRKTTGALGSTAKGPSAPKAVLDGPAAGEGEIPRRPLGKTGMTVSALGLGGHHLGDADSVNEAMNIVHEAVDVGVTFFDNCWEYHNGKSENWLGRALTGGRRDKVVLMTKVCTHGRDKRVAMQQLEESLLCLRTDHLDLWQIHECVYYDDPELHFAADGVWQAMLDAKKQGKVRFTEHKTPQIHLRMLALADQNGLHFDTVQMPLNPFDATYRSFQQYVLPEALKRGMGVIGMKSMGGRGEPILQGVLTPQEALRYAMSLPASVTVSGIDSLQVPRQNLDVAKGFQPMMGDEMLALARRWRRTATWRCTRAPASMRRRSGALSTIRPHSKNCRCSPGNRWQSKNAMTGPKRRSGRRNGGSW